MLRHADESHHTFSVDVGKVSEFFVLLFFFCGGCQRGEIDASF